MTDHDSHGVNENAGDGAEVQEKASSGDPAQEWGGRNETGKAIVRGGKSEGEVAGAGGKPQPAEPERQG